MTGFQFPPPPPPPPPQSNSTESFSNASNRSSQSFRGRGRARSQGSRPRGNSLALHRGHHEPSLQVKRTSNQDSAVQDRSRLSITRPIHTTRSVPKPEPAPLVPQFGTAVPQSRVYTSNKFSAPLESTQTSSSTTCKDSTKTPRKKLNALGLTPAGAEYSSSDEDEEANAVDEEKPSSAQPELLEFEHKGMLIKLDSPAAIKQWIEQRRKNWPTNAKADAAKATRLQMQQRKNHIHNDAPQVHVGDASELSISPAAKLSRLQDAETRLEHMRKASKAEPPDVRPLSHTSSSTLTLVDDSASTTDDDSSPEEMSRQSGQPHRLPPPTRMRSKGAGSDGAVASSGSCANLQRGESLDAHPTNQRGLVGNKMDGKRSTLKELLMERQFEQDATRILEAIKAVSAAGLLEN